MTTIVDGKRRRYRISCTPIVVGILMMTGLAVFQILKQRQINVDNECDRITQLSLTPGIVIDQTEGISPDVNQCYRFDGYADQTLSVLSTQAFTLILPNGEQIVGKGHFSYNFKEPGNYQIRLEKLTEDNSISNLQLAISQDSDTAFREININVAEPVLSFDSNISSEIRGETYIPDTLPSFTSSQRLKDLVSNIVQLAEDRNLPVDKLSISLLELNSERCCSYAAWNDAVPRYPASVVKLFWLVALYSQYNSGLLDDHSISEDLIHKMIADSDNESASQVLDLITQTTSGDSLNPDTLRRWIDKRYSINIFFEKAQYQDINISQKTFPIPYLQLDGPQGREAQMRGDEVNPIRNYLTTCSVARLLYEIHSNQAITPEWSQRIKSHLLRNLEPNSWKYKPFNSIEGFLGESLPSNTVFYSKAGWTSANRNDAAIIESADQKAQYILVVFGDSPEFKEDEEFFPILSQNIYSQINLF